jgi:excisionase family DNA binding protein
MSQTDDLIGSAEAARILGKSPRTIHRLVDSGTLTPAVVAPGGFAGAFLFRRADVEALVEAKSA